MMSPPIGNRIPVMKSYHTLDNIFFVFIFFYSGSIPNSIDIGDQIEAIWEIGTLKNCFLWVIIKTSKIINCYALRKSIKWVHCDFLILLFPFWKFDHVVTFVIIIYAHKLFQLVNQCWFLIHLFILNSM